MRAITNNLHVLTRIFAKFCKIALQQQFMKETEWLAILQNFANILVSTWRLLVIALIITNAQMMMLRRNLAIKD
jgi:hypothetical protein